jgi:hypothetical protein
MEFFLIKHIYKDNTFITNIIYLVIIFLFFIVYEYFKNRLEKKNKIVIN